MTPGAAHGALRVAVVCPYDLSRPGGVQGQALGLSKALRRLGHEVVVVAPDDRPAGWVTGHVYAAGRSIGVPANGSVAPVCLSPAAALRALRAVERWRADVVHLHEPLAPALGYGLLARSRRPLVATVHRSGVGPLLAAARPLAYLARRRIAVCCAVSASARASAQVLWGGDCRLLFNGVDVDRFAKAVPVPAERPAVLFVGRHERRKGLDVLLGAFEKVAATSMLWIVGTGPESARLQARHPPSARVRWLGTLSDAEVADRMKGAAVLCAPSLGGESFGMVLLEAMAAGCPVVCSDIDGYRQASADHALLVPPGDADALGAALSRVLADPPSPRARNAARAHAQGWSMDRLGSCYADVYEEAIALRRSQVPGMSQVS